MNNIERDSIRSTLDQNTNDIQATWLGTVEYSKALALQMEYASQWKNNHQHKYGIILGVEHPSIITLGKRAEAFQDIKCDYEIPYIKIDRGGQATLHSPGQLVIYPILNIQKMNLEIKQYVRLLEQSTLDFLKEFGVSGHLTSQPGVYTNQGKIAFIGIRVENGISRHGISINIFNELNLFNGIKSCGTENAKLDKLSRYMIDSDATCATISKNDLMKKYFHKWTECFFGNSLDPINSIKQSACCS